MDEAGARRAAAKRVSGRLVGPCRGAACAVLACTLGATPLCMPLLPPLYAEWGRQGRMPSRRRWQLAHSWASVCSRRGGPGRPRRRCTCHRPRRPGSMLCVAPDWVGKGPALRLLRRAGEPSRSAVAQPPQSHLALSRQMVECSQLDRQIEKLRNCELISESDVESLCVKAREILMQESNVLSVSTPITVRPAASRPCRPSHLHTPRDLRVRGPFADLWRHPWPVL